MGGNTAAGGRPPALRTVTLAPEPASAGIARRFVAGALAALDLSQFLDVAELAASELVTNAVLHARTDIELRLAPAGDGVRVEVRDGSPLLPAVREYGGYATTGRGLGLVASLVAELGVTPVEPAGKDVWFTVTASSLAGGETDAGAAAWAGDWGLDWEELIEAASSAPAAARLEGVPVALWMAAAQHHDAVLRELVLYRAEHPASPDLRARLEVADTAATELAAAIDRALARAEHAGAPVVALPPGHPAPLPLVPATVTAEVPLTPGLNERLAALQDTLDEAERLAAQGALLVRPALPEIVAVRDWCCEQVIAQANGIAPTSWAGDGEGLFLRSTRARTAVPLPTWDETPVRDSDRCVVAADDHNRLVAVSAPAARLLGWDVDDLTGRRVVTLIPERHREAHIAGFTRHLATGESRLLGVRLELPVLRADGQEIVCGFFLERAPAAGGRTVYLVWLTPPSA